MPGFHTTVRITWIAVNDSNDISDLMETSMNDPGDSKDQDRWSRSMFYPSGPNLCDR